MDTVLIEDILKTDASLAALSHLEKTEYKGETLLLGNLLESFEKGFEPGSENYTLVSDSNFIRISDLNDYDLTFVLNEKIQKIIPPKSQQSMVYTGDILYQTASNVGNVCIYMDSKPAYYNSHLVKLNFIKDREYLFAFLKSNISKSQLGIAGSIKGVDNFRKEFLTGLKVVFPTIDNHESPEQVKKYISDIVKNLIHKEVLVKNKNKQIDSIIMNELNSNSLIDNFDYSLPRINDFLDENRIDTSVMLESYKELERKILNYKNSYYYLSKYSISPGVTPKDHIYSDEKNNTNSLWITPKNLDQRKLVFKTYIDTKTKSKVKKNDIIISGIRYVGNGFYINGNEEVYANQNTLIIRSSESDSEQRVLLCYLTSEIGRKMLLHRRVMGTVPILYKEQLIRVPIPNLPTQIKETIDKLYYNEVEFDLGELDYENYYRERNLKLGIYQLNEEIIKLQEHLNELMVKISSNQKIDIKYEF